MEKLKDIGRALFAVVVALTIIGLVLTVTVGLGYFIGVVLSFIPFINGFLTFGTGITNNQIPTYTAWMALGALFIAILSPSGTKKAKKPTKSEGDV